MNALGKSLAALVLTLLASSSAFAQGGGGYGMMGGGSPVMLLANASVQKELKLDDKQVEDATKLASETREKMMAARDEVSGLEGEARREKMMEINKKIADENKKPLADLLKPEQAKRLHQISLQQRGASAMADAEVQKNLKLTDEQKEKVKAMMAEMPAKMQAAFQDAGDDQNARREKMTALQKEMADSAQALLTDDQKKSYQNLLGDKFEIVRQPRN